MTGHSRLDLIQDLESINLIGW